MSRAEIFNAIKQNTLTEELWDKTNDQWKKEAFESVAWKGDLKMMKNLLNLSDKDPERLRRMIIPGFRAAVENGKFNLAALLLDEVKKTPDDNNEIKNITFGGCTILNGEMLKKLKILRDITGYSAAGLPHFRITDQSWISDEEAERDRILSNMVGFRDKLDLKFQDLKGVGRDAALGLANHVIINLITEDIDGVRCKVDNMIELNSHVRKTYSRDMGHQTGSLPPQKIAISSIRQNSDLKLSLLSDDQWSVALEEIQKFFNNTPDDTITPTTSSSAQNRNNSNTNSIPD